MILGQIGKQPHCKADAVHPIHGQRVRGNLHHHVAAARIRHTAQQLLQLPRPRGSALCRQCLLPHAILHCADETHTGTSFFFQNMSDQHGGGCFPVGAGNTHHGHLFGRMVKVVFCNQSQRPPGRRHLHKGEFHRRRLLTYGAHGAIFQSLLYELTAVGSSTGDSDKQVAGAGGTGIIADAQHLCFRICVDGCDLYPSE